MESIHCTSGRLGKGKALVQSHHHLRLERITDLHLVNWQRFLWRQAGGWWRVAVHVVRGFYVRIPLGCIRLVYTTPTALGGKTNLYTLPPVKPDPSWNGDIGITSVYGYLSNAKSRQYALGRVCCCVSNINCRVIRRHATTRYFIEQVSRSDNPEE